MIPGGARPAAAAAVTALTILLVVSRPRRLPEGLAAAAGATIMLLLGLADPAHSARAVSGNWNVLLFFAGLMAVAGLADEAGVFEAITGLALRLGAGSPVRLLGAICAAAALVTCLFSNDAAALILTPVVVIAARRAGADPLPYALATSYMADAASGLLPVANPVNVLTVDALHIGLATYVRVLLLPALLVAVATAAALLVALRPRLTPLQTQAPAAAAEPLLRPATAVLLGLAIAYVAASTIGVPVGPVAAGGAAVLALAVARSSPRRLRRLTGDISWSVLLFVAALFVVVQGLEDTGVTATVLRWWLGSGAAPAPNAVVAFLGAAAGSNLVNNLPMALITLSGLHPLGAAAATPALAAALGADIGPNLTPVGSLATLLWLVLLRTRGVAIGSRTYIYYGVIVTIPALLAGAAGLAVTAR